MKSVNKICMSVLLLGAAAIAVPAMAQEASTNASAAQNTQAAAPSTSTETAMNSSAAANADVSSVGDTSKKYHRATRAKDFAAEKKITEQLNRQASMAAKPTQTASNQ